MRFFIIGNSFSQNATRYLPQLAAEGGHALEVGRAEVGGCSIQRHWEHVEAAEKGEPEGKFYSGRSLEGAEDASHEPKSLRELLVAKTWDLVMFHQASLPSSNIQSYRPYAHLLHDYIRELCPSAEILLHQTWAYRCDAPFWGETEDGGIAADQQEMWAKSRAAYHTVAGELGVRLVPTGDAFWMTDSDPEWGYRPDENFNFQRPAFPELPDQTHSLHAGYYWNENREFCIDPKHTSNAGAYLGSLVWYGFLWGVSPETVQFVPEGVDAPFAARLRQAAARALRPRPEAVRV